MQQAEVIKHYVVQNLSYFPNANMAFFSNVQTSQKFGNIQIKSLNIK